MIYAIFVRPEAGYDADVQKARNAGLVVGNKYELEDAEIGRFMSKVFLKGYQEGFNSAQFDFLNEENPNYNFYDDKQFYDYFC